MSAFDISLTPFQFEYSAQPGAVITQAYEITNNADNTIVLDTSVSAWQPSGIDGNVSYSQAVNDPQINFSLNNADLALGQAFRLQPRESRQLVLKIKTGPQVELKDYYYTFFINQNQAGAIDTGDNSTQTNGRIGSHILLSVSAAKNQSASGETENFKVLPRFKDVFLTPVSFQAEIKNNADYFFKTDGKLTVTKNNLTIKEFKLMPSNVLAHYSRSVSCLADSGGDKTPPASVSCTLRPPFWPGSYTATLTLNKSISSKPVTVSFFVFPFSPLIVIVLLFFLYLGFRSFRRR